MQFFPPSSTGLIFASSLILAQTSQAFPYPVTYSPSVATCMKLNSDVTVSYRPALNMWLSRILQLARYHFKQGVESYRKLVVLSSSYRRALSRVQCEGFLGGEKALGLYTPIRTAWLKVHLWTCRNTCWKWKLIKNSLWTCENTCWKW